MSRVLVLLLGFLVVGISGCMKDADYPLAQLDYKRIAKAPESTNYLHLYFSSNISLDAIFNRAEGISRTSEVLECSLEQPAIFAMDHVIPVVGSGLIDREGQIGARFFYKASLFFGETQNNGGHYKYISRDRFMALADGRHSIPCKVKISALWFEAYYSEAFDLPVADVLPLIPEQRER